MILELFFAALVAVAGVWLVVLAAASEGIGGWGRLCLFFFGAASLFLATALAFITFAGRP